MKENEEIQRSSILIERERFLKSVTSNVANLTMDNLSMRLKEYEVKNINYLTLILFYKYSMIMSTSNLRL